MHLVRVILFAPDVVATAGFYHRTFGFGFVGPSDDKEFLQLDAGGCLIAIHKGNPPSGPGQTPKLVFRSDDVPGEKARLRALGVKLGSILEAPDFVFCDGRDPAGNVFQISSRP